MAASASFSHFPISNFQFPLFNARHVSQWVAGDARFMEYSSRFESFEGKRFDGQTC